MKFSLKEKRLGNVSLQRNFLAGLCLSLLVTNLLQTSFLFFKNERIIIIPPELKQSFHVEEKRFSPQYLEEMGV